ncbi:sterol desaturase family protein [Umboniibacter marinipuniceus]|uniref:Sterol desaturase/sphingolipid hydroxylase (Fatty acid hydroxylase superfamily) n=1 Tax=Umboniibacter marinipuniceus TaxID=569599 RepID=A0A3M0AIU6_9GAMM|nr:sterol desaturase family protein [Umboniibacter marinipuniceus]RMA82638.1 sterol desaturase/sphingolipid hydroxylase (fatty acid hydroxylase superfamily) [Umboniibacter marinipuniceus]
MNNEYEYQERVVHKNSDKEFRLGEGRISGYLSFTLGLLSLLAVFAYLYPSHLTTTELRAVYDAEALQLVLKYGMYFSLFFALLTVVLNRGRYKKLGFWGGGFTLLGFALGGYSIPVGDVAPRALSLGVDWLILAFLLSTLVFMLLEKLFPKYKDQLILRPQWGLDLYYFCFNHLAISAILIFTNYHVGHFDWALSQSFQAWVQSIPVWAQVVMIIICADFVLYWEHRLYHEVKPLWPIHAVHHSVEDLDWLAGSRGHFIQVFSERAMVMVPLYLLGADTEALNIYVTFAALQAVYIHCNTSISLGPLKYVLVTPQFHHWHHSSEKPAIDTNYSAHTVLFDRLFGTYHMPNQHWPAKYGTTVPLPTDVVGQTLYPITALVKKK